MEREWQVAGRTRRERGFVLWRDIHGWRAELLAICGAVMVVVAVVVAVVQQWTVCIHAETVGIARKIHRSQCLLMNRP